MPMWWFREKAEPDEQWPIKERLASSEFVSALIEIAEMYEAREKQARHQLLIRATELSRKDRFNYLELEERYIGEIRREIANALQYQGLAAEVRDWIQDYEHRGRRPPYMPPLPPQPEQPSSGGE